MMRAAYSLLWLLGLPLVLLRLLWRARNQPDYLRHWGERFGLVAQRGVRPIIWLHAVSVGETRAAQPLVVRLLDAYPQHDILLTHTTPTGRATGAELFASNTRVRQSYLPYDLPWAVRAFLRRATPSIGIIMETEIWPNLLHAAHAFGIPTVLANARLSERSFKGYSRLGRLAREAVGYLHSVGAQSAADANRLDLLGASNIKVTGNMKYELTVNSDMQALGAQFKARAAGRPVIVLASTRDGEEALFLQALIDLEIQNTLLVIVPRHPQRFDAVGKLVEARGLRLARRSQGLERLTTTTQVWLGDSMGEMQAYFAMSDVAIIGGSWLPLGGQNLLEACALGVPVIVGPHTFNFAEAAELAIKAGAAARCLNATQALATACRFNKDAATRARMGWAGRAFVAQHRGATDKTMALIREVMPNA